MAAFSEVRRVFPIRSSSSEAPDLSIILATYNESASIGNTLDLIFRVFPESVEVIVVDDDSPDGTAAIAEERGDRRVRVICRRAERGLASAVRRGTQEARGKVIAWFDCDMGYVVKYLPSMLAQLGEADIVIGSRYVPGGADRRPARRVLPSLCINALARFFLGARLRDYDSGFAVVRAEVLRRVEIRPPGFGEYFIEFLHESRRKGFRILEHPYVLTQRDKGASKSATHLRTFLRFGLGYARRVLQVWFRSFSGIG